MLARLNRTIHLDSPSPAAELISRFRSQASPTCRVQVSDHRLYLQTPFKLFSSSAYPRELRVALNPLPAGGTHITARFQYRLPVRMFFLCFDGFILVALLACAYNQFVLSSFDFISWIALGMFIAISRLISTVVGHNYASAEDACLESVLHQTLASE